MKGNITSAMIFMDDLLINELWWFFIASNWNFFYNNFSFLFPDLFQFLLQKPFYPIFYPPSSSKMMCYTRSNFLLPKGYEIYTKLYSLLILISLRILPKSNKVLKWFLRRHLLRLEGDSRGWANEKSKVDETQSKKN